MFTSMAVTGIDWETATLTYVFLRDFDKDAYRTGFPLQHKPSGGLCALERGVSRHSGCRIIQGRMARRTERRTLHSTRWATFSLQTGGEAGPAMTGAPKPLAFRPSMMVKITDNKISSREDLRGSHKASSVQLLLTRGKRRSA